MKKIITSIIVIGMLLNVLPTITSGEKIIDKSSSINDELLQTSNDEDIFEEPTFVPGEILIKFKDDLNLGFSESPNGITSLGINSIDTLNTKYYVKSTEKIFKNTKISSLSNVYKFLINKDANVLQVVDAYNKNPNVEYAQPNYKMKTQLIPNDDFYHSSGSWGQSFDDLWGLKTISCEDAWEITTGSEDVVVAIVDSGVDYNHPDISENMWINEDEILGNGLDDDNDGFVDNIYGTDYVNNDSDPMDDNGHGTHCAGTVAAVGNNSLGVVGVNWKAKIMAVKGLDAGGSGNTADLAEGICWAADQGAKVISNSWGSFSRRPSDPISEDAVRYAFSKGCIVVFAAGNNNDDVKYYSPNNMDEVISVAATDSNDLMASFSNWGGKIDVCAPGVNILSLRANNTKNDSMIVEEKYLILNGTSMACPHVAGLAALLLSKNPTLSPQEVKSILINTSDEIFSMRPTGGRINAKKAIWDGIGLAEINRKTDWSNIKDLFEINGTAWGDNFQYYVLDYGKGKNPPLWNEITNSTAIVENLILGSLNTNTLVDGLYTLRLRVICDEGMIRDFMSIVVNNENNTYIVDDDLAADFNCIQDAVDDAGMSDTILVKNGTYLEHILIDKTINLFGENNESTIIQGFKRKQSIISIIADGVVIKNFMINGTTGFFNKQFGVIINCNQNTIMSNKFFNLIYGITIWNSSNNFINNNLINDSLSVGIFVYEGLNNIISENFIFNGSSGIQIMYSDESIIFNNTLSNNRAYGIVSGFSTKNKIINNTFLNNGINLIGDDLSSWNTHIIQNNYVNNEPILYLKNLTDETFDNQNIGQLIIANCSNITIQNFTISHTDYGLQLGFSSENTVMDTNISNSYMGFYISGSNDNKILNCSLYKIKFIGLRLVKGSQDNNISLCKFIQNKAPIYVELSNNNVFSLNNISNSNESGVYLRSSNYNTFKKNFINNNRDGISFTNSSNNIVNNNNIVKNQIGIKIESGYYDGEESSDNKIYCNYLIDNTENANDEQNNQWDNGEKGNYWDDYDGVDADNDGIGDTPYDIPGGDNQDLYPLGRFKDSTPPILKILKPINALYIFNYKIRNYIIRKPLIIGRINITVDAKDDDSGVNRVEFYIDDELMENDTAEPYNFIWNDRTIFKHKHTIKAIAYDNEGNSASNEIIVRKFL